MAGGKPDWERIESDYRAGVLSLREIAASDGDVTEGAIRKRAKRDNWARDLNAKIQARADELVRKQAVREEVRSTQSATDRLVIEANAQQIAQVRGEHRADIGRARTLVLSLLGELEQATGSLELFRNLGELMQNADDKGVDKLNEAYHKVISLSGRVGNVKALSEALKNLVGLEREAYDIGSGKAAEPPADENPRSAVDTTRQILFALHLGQQRAKQAANDAAQPVPARQALP